MNAANNVSQIDSAMEKMNQAWQAASEDMYKAQQQAGGANPGQQGSNPNDNVTDVDHEEVK